MMHCVFKLITLYSILSAFGSKSDVEAGGTSKFQARGWAVGALSCFFLVTDFDSLEMVHHPRMARVHRLNSILILSIIGGASPRTRGKKGMTI